VNVLVHVNVNVPGKNIKMFGHVHVHVISSKVKLQVRFAPLPSVYKWHMRPTWDKLEQQYGKTFWNHSCRGQWIRGW
jgi:hypothetical protein